MGNRFPWNGLRYLGDSGNGGMTLDFLSPFLWRAPTLELRIIIIIIIFLLCSYNFFKNISIKIFHEALDCF